MLVVIVNSVMMLTQTTSLLTMLLSAGQTPSASPRPSDTQWNTHAHRPVDELAVKL